MSSEPTNTPSSSFLDRWLPKSGRAFCICIVAFCALFYFGLWLLIALSTRETASIDVPSSGRSTHPAFTSVQVLGAFLVPLIAGLAAYIAWQQKETAEYKVKLDLFDRRYRVYRGVMDLLAAVSDESVTPEVLGKFHRETDAKRFLFGDDINDYMKEIHGKVVDVRHLRRLIEPQARISEERRLEAIDKETNLVSWLAKEINEAAKKFDRYMSFKKL